MKSIYQTLSLIVLLGVLPYSTHADLIQDSADIRTTDEFKPVSGWSQDLGTNLTGTLTGASFPIRFSPSIAYGPRFELRLDIFPDETYTGSLGFTMWGNDLVNLTPLPTIEEVDSLLTFDLSEDSLGYSFLPQFAYRISLGLSSFSSGGMFQVYGSAEDVYESGATTAGGIQDMAFRLFGIDKAATASTTDGEVITYPTVSNVLFLPGIKGSRIYQGDITCEDCERLLWEPSGNDSVEQLMLNEHGVSIYENIYVRDEEVIAEVLNRKFYSSFFEDMARTEGDNRYGPDWKWKPIAYDWRLSLNDLVNKGLKDGDRIYYTQSTSTPYIEQTLRELAASSPTGKVTIVAHSNGGLVAKALMRKLGASESAALVDDVVFVGVPQIGAPQSIGALLYGYGEALPFDQCADSLILGWICGLFVDRNTARTFAEHAPMGYHLLPSHTYVRFGASDDHPIAKFTASTQYALERMQYGDTLNTADELYDFLLARDGERQKPAPNDLHTPNVLSERLVDYARSIHSSIDSWTPPAPMTLHQIAGWGAPTVSGIEFYEEPRFLGMFGTTTARYRPLFSQNGDGVVPQYSAAPLSGGFSRRYWIDLPKVNEEIDVEIGHSNLLELSALSDMVHAVLTDSPLPSELLTVAPTPDRQDKWRIFLLHSPLTLELYDEEGNHVGEVAGGFESQIPNVTYGEFGEVKYLIAPAEGEYTLELRGKDTGSFSLDIQEIQGGKIGTSTTLASIPSTQTTVARVQVTDGMTDSTITMDYDNNGTTDASLTSVMGQTAVYDGPPPIPRTEPESETPTDPDPIPTEPVVITESGPSNGWASRSGQKVVLKTPSLDRDTSSSTEQYEIISHDVDPIPERPEEVSTSSESEHVEDIYPESIQSHDRGELVPASTVSASAVSAGETILRSLWDYIVEKVTNFIHFITQR